MTKASAHTSIDTTLGNIFLKKFEESTHANKAVYAACNHDFEPVNVWPYFAGRAAMFAYMIGKIDHTTQTPVVMASSDMEYHPFIGNLPADAIDHILTIAENPASKENYHFDIGMKDIAIYLADMLNLHR